MAYYTDRVTYDNHYERRKVAGWTLAGAILMAIVAPIAQVPMLGIFEIIAAALFIGAIYTIVTSLPYTVEEPWSKEQYEDRARRLAERRKDNQRIFDAVLNALTHVIPITGPAWCTLGQWTGKLSYHNDETFDGLFEFSITIVGHSPLGERGEAVAEYWFRDWRLDDPISEPQLQQLREGARAAVHAKIKELAGTLGMACSC